MHDDDDTSPANTVSVCHCHYSSFYCPECSKTVCSCTVKDHLVCKCENVCKRNDIDNAVQMGDLVSGSVFLYTLLPLCILLNLHNLTTLMCLNVPSSTNSLYWDLYSSGCNEAISGKRILKVSSSSMGNLLMTDFTNTLIITNFNNKMIKHCQMDYTINPNVVKSSLSCDDKVQLNASQPQGTRTEKIIVIWMLALVLLLYMSVFLHFVSVYCYDENNDIWAANNCDSKVEKNLPLGHYDGFEKDLECIPGKEINFSFLVYSYIAIYVVTHIASQYEFITYIHKQIFNIGNFSSKFNELKMLQSSQCLSEKLLSCNYVAEELLNAQIKNYMFLRAITVCKEISSLNGSFLHSKHRFKEITNHLPVLLGGCDLLSYAHLDDKYFLLSQKEVTCFFNQSMVDKYCLTRNTKDVATLANWNMCSYPMTNTESWVCKQESWPINCGMLIVSSNKLITLYKTQHQGVSKPNKLITLYKTQHWGVPKPDVFRPVNKGIKPVSLPRNQQTFSNPMDHKIMASQVNYNNADGSITANTHIEDKQQTIQQSNAATKDKNDSLKIQPESYHVAASKNATNTYSPHLGENINERDGRSLHPEKKSKAYVSSEKNTVEKDGKLSLADDTNQATPLLSVPLAHDPMIGNIGNKPIDHNPLGDHIVKSLPIETEVLQSVGPQLNALYNTNFGHEVQSSHKEVRRKGNAKTTFYQHEVEQHGYNPIKKEEINPIKNTAEYGKLQVKVPEVKTDRSKAANEFKPKPLPKRSCIVCGDQQYPLVNNLISHPHMDQGFVKERTEINPSHYLAKLVPHYQYLIR